MQPGGSLAGQDGGAGRGADRLRAIGGGEAHARGGKAVEIRGVVIPPSITVQIVDPEVIAQDEKKVRLSPRSFHRPGGPGGSSADDETGQQARSKKDSETGIQPTL